MVILSRNGSVIKNNGRKEVCHFGVKALEKSVVPSSDKANELWEEALKGEEVNFPNDMHHPLAYTLASDTIEKNIDYTFNSCNECVFCLRKVSLVFNGLKVIMIVVRIALK